MDWIFWNSRERDPMSNLQESDSALAGHGAVHDPYGAEDYEQGRSGEAC